MPNRVRWTSGQRRRGPTGPTPKWHRSGRTEGEGRGGEGKGSVDRGQTAAGGVGAAGGTCGAERRKDPRDPREVEWRIRCGSNKLERRTHIPDGLQIHAFKFIHVQNKKIQNVED